MREHIECVDCTKTHISIVYVIAIRWLRHSRLLDRSISLTSIEPRKSLASSRLFKSSRLYYGKASDSKGSASWSAAQIMSPTLLVLSCSIVAGVTDLSIKLSIVYPMCSMMTLFCKCDIARPSSNTPPREHPSRLSGAAPGHFKLRNPCQPRARTF